MANSALLSISSGDLTLSSIVLLAIPLTIVSLLVLTYAYTTVTYYLSIRYFANGSPSTPQQPPGLPYTLPFLGHALSFSSTTPGAYFRFLQNGHFSSYPNLGSLTLLLAGQRAHILNSPDLVSKLLKAKGISRVRFNRDIMVNAMGLGESDDRKAYGGMRDGKEGGAPMEKANHDGNTEFLLNQTAVNVLTRKFMEVFQEELEKACEDGKQLEVPFYEFLREKMFAASTTALYGREIIRMNPDLSTYYWDFDNGVLARLFGVPKFMQPAAYKSLEALLDRWEQWVKVVRSKYGDEPPKDMEWDDLMGAAVVRHRHRMYSHFDLSDRGRASYDLGFMFGLNSNAIPATGWTLSHLLSPTNAVLLALIKQEVESARNADGTIDINTLIGMPYLNSAFNETLRMYVDVLVTRTLNEDLTLNQYHMKKGGIIIAPSYLGHHDTDAWEKDDMPSEKVWYGERFLQQDEKTGKVTFTTAGTNGRFFPFGGGPYICPGRVFAKQEVFGAIGAFLLAYDIEFVQYLRFDKSGNPIRKGINPSGFPVVKKQFCGSGVVISEGDMLVKLKRRKW